MHVDGCAACGRSLMQQRQFLAALSASLHNGGRTIELPKDFTTKIVASAESSVSGVRRPDELFTAVCISAALILFVLFAFWGMPLRVEDKQTVIFAAYEQQVREIARDPLELFSPTFTAAFVGLEAASLLFWFIISLAFSTIAPGAVGRAVVRIKLSSTKVVAIGFFTFIGASAAFLTLLSVSPKPANAMLPAIAVLTLTPTYVFGRVVLHASVGNLIRKQFLSGQNRSEALSVLLGVLAWTILLCVPYLWAPALLILLSAGIGLVLTARPTSAWKTL